LAADEGLHSSKKEQADLMKTLITEPTYKSEQKFHEPQNLTSYHNYIGASNHTKALNITHDCRRYAIFNTTLMQYSHEKWSELWSLVNNPVVREIFFQYLRTCIDSTGVRIGRAPMTAAKAAQASEQCPVAAKWLKSVILDRPNAAAHVPADVDDYDERAAWENDKIKMTFKSRGPIPPAISNLLGDDLEEELIRRESHSQGGNSVKCLLPVDHVTKCITKYVSGQSWLRFNEADLKETFASIGILPGKHRCCLAGQPRRGLYIFPSIEGCIYKLKKKGWMTSLEAGEEVEDLEY